MFYRIWKGAPVWRCVLVVMALACGFNAFSQSTSFTYQGRLAVGGVITNGSYDFTFSLFNSASGGTQMGVTRTNSWTAVTNGIFLAALDFGNVFDGTARWLQIGVRPGGSNSLPFTLLTPRQQLTAAPYSLYAQNAGAVNGASVVASNSATLAGQIKFAGNSAAPGYIWTATDANGSGQWQPASTLIAGGVTNLSIIATGSGEIPANSGFTIQPTNILSDWPVSGQVISYWQLFPILSNSTYNAGFDLISTAQRNSYGDPQGDLTYSIGFNSHANTQPINTNQSQWQEQIESCWQNFSGSSQLEYWKSWGTPFTTNGTNAAWRWMGGDLYWNPTTHQYQGSDMGFYVDNFYLGGAFGRQAFSGQYPVQFAIGAYGESDMTHYGIITTKTNLANNGGVSILGGNLSLRNGGGDKGFSLHFDEQRNAISITSSDNAAFVLRARMPLLLDFQDNNGQAVPIQIHAPAGGQTGDIFDYTDAYGNATYARITGNGSAIFPNLIATTLITGNGAAITNLNWNNIANPPPIPATNGLATLTAVTNIAATQAQLASQNNFRSGVFNTPDMSTNVTITFTTPLATTNYSVTATPEFNSGGVLWWISSKTTNGFNLNLSAGIPGGGCVSWQAMLFQ